MSNLSGYSWGATVNTNGDSGGVVSWSIAPSGLDTGIFPSGPGTSVDPSLIFSFDYTALIDQAFDAWSQYGDIEFIELPDGGGNAGQGFTADIRIFFGPVPGNTLGWTYFPTGPSNSAAGDMILDIDASMINDPDKFYKLVLHEIGHALGLDHENSGVPTVMTSTLSVGTLQQDDIQGIQAVYGAQDNANWSYDLADGQVNFVVTNSSPGLIVNGNGQHNEITGNDANNILNGNSGFDTMYGGAGFDTMYGGLGNDTLDGGDNADSLLGGEGDDNLIGGQGTDVLYGDAGNDTLNSGDSADRLYGGEGDDVLYAGWAVGTTVDGLWGEAGNDTLYGELGYDLLDGGIGNDLLDGGNQADNLYGQAGNDTLHGGQGFDRLLGGDGDDLLFGGTESDGLFGGTGDDTLNGESGNDRFFGETGNDLIDGGTGSDTIGGGAGFDTLIGGEGDDLLLGNFNADRFVFADAHGNDTIGDFAADNVFEKIDLSGVSAITDLADLTSNHMTQAGVNVVIDTGSGNSITLNGVSLGDLDATDFIF